MAGYPDPMGPVGLANPGSQRESSWGEALQDHLKGRRKP